MKALVGMTDFVLEQMEGKVLYHHLESVLNYANFLRQPLELWMFVPCDEDGNVLKEPDQNNPKYDIWISNDEVDCNYGLYDKDYLEYKQAKERCLFEGFSYKKEFDNNYSIFIKHVDLLLKFDIILQEMKIASEIYVSKNNTIEHLKKYNLTLTPTALKQIGL